MECRNHPGIAAIERCDRCGQPFCYECLVAVGGWNYCAACQAGTVPGQAPPVLAYRSATCDEALWALILSLVGIFCCLAIVLEPVALILAAKAKKKIDADPRWTGRGMATAAQVIAIVIILLYILYGLAIVAAEFS